VEQTVEQAAFDWVGFFLSAVVPAIVAIVTAIVTAGITARSQFKNQQAKLREELKLEYSVETSIKQLLGNQGWELRSFAEIARHLRGFEDNELRRHLVRAGAIAFNRRKDGQEMWGLLERNTWPAPTLRIGRERTLASRSRRNQATLAAYLASARRCPEYRAGGAR
jgi:hypothetical protein